MKKRIFKFAVLCFALVGLYDVVTCSVMIYPQKNQQNLLHYTGPVTEKELQAFLPIWEDFMEKYNQEIGISAISFAEQQPSKVLPEDMISWLNGKKWDADRFFYVEQRLYDIINDVYIKRHAQDVVEVLRTSLDSEKDVSSRENMENIIAIQEKILNSRAMNSQEFKFIEKNFNEIQKVIDK